MYARPTDKIQLHWKKRKRKKKNLCSYTKAKATGNPTFMPSTKSNSMETREPFVRLADPLPEGRLGHYMKSQPVPLPITSCRCRPSPHGQPPGSKTRIGHWHRAAPHFRGCIDSQALESPHSGRKAGRVGPRMLWLALTSHQSCPRPS